MSDQVEILMAVYNGEPYLYEQLDSIFRQSYQNISLTVRDNCSSDGTLKILDHWKSKYPNAMRIIAGERNLGVVGNFAALIDQAKAPYVMLSDADDVWFPHKAEKSLHLMQMMEKECGKDTPLLVHTDLAVTDATLKMKYSSFWKETLLDGSRTLSLKRALVENQVTGCTVMMNRPQVLKARPIPLDVPMHDAWLALVASSFGRVISLNEPTLFYRQHGKNDSGATRYGLSPYLKKLFDPKKKARILEIRKKRVLQAELFLNRYRGELPLESLEVVLRYLKVHRSSHAIRPFLLYKHGLLETGFLRKCYQIIST